MGETIIIRADGSKTIGMGHIARAATIYDYINNKYKINVSLLIKYDESAIRFLEGRAINYKVISPDVDVAHEAHIIKKEYFDNSAKLLILDVLENDINPIFMGFFKYNKIPVMAITDDSNKRVIDATIIVNGNPNQINISYNDPYRYFIGPKYFIMDNCYGAIKNKVPNGILEKLLLSVGGSDHNNIIFKVISAIDKINHFSKIHIVTSKSSGYLPKLQALLQQMGNRYELLVDIPSLKGEFDWSDFAITAGGNTLFERIASKTPGMTICQLNRQMEIANKFSALGCNINIGYGPNLTTNFIERSVVNFLKEPSKHLEQYKKSHLFVDGKGLERVSKIIIKMIGG